MREKSVSKISIIVGNLVAIISIVTINQSQSSYFISKPLAFETGSKEIEYEVFMANVKQIKIILVWIIKTYENYDSKLFVF